MLFAICAPVLLIMAALVADGANLYLVKSRLQSAADAAALGGVIELPDSGSAQSSALSIALANVPSGYGTVAKHSDVSLGNWSETAGSFTAGGTPTNALKITVQRSAAYSNATSTFFARYFGQKTEDVSASAIGVTRLPTSCFYLLDSSASGAFTGKGGGAINIVNCGVQINSRSETALAISNNSTLSATKVCIVGSDSGSAAPNATLETGCASAADPLAYLQEPSPAACTYYSGETTLSPATYCNSSMNISNATMNSGTYYFEGVNLTFDGNVTGSGVTIFLDKNSSVTFKSNGTISLSAPASGAYKGILIFQSRSAPSSTINTAVGGPSFTLSGTIYTPTTSWVLKGSSSGSSAASLGYFVADSVSDTGSISFDFSNGSGLVPFGFQHTRLVD